MSRMTSKKLNKYFVGGLPIIRDVIDRMKLREILYRYIPRHGNETIAAVESLLVVIYNLTVGKAPLYELEQWAASLDCRVLGHSDPLKGQFNDDRFGRALDKLYEADRCSILTELVTTVVKQFNLDLSQIHNDSTTVKACGSIPGRTRTGLELKNGNSKDYRPDLKQLVYSLSISADGAVPVHQHCYPGNRTDDTTHIETWKTLCSIHGNADFLYIADSKLCTDEQLHFITSRKGCAVTMLPNTWKETQEFKARLRKTRKLKQEIFRRIKPGSETEMEYFYAYQGTYYTHKRGYRIHWIYSSEKRKRDRAQREKQMRKAEHELADLNAKINRRKLKDREAIEAAANEILTACRVKNFYRVQIGTIQEKQQVQTGKGRPGKDTQYQIRITTLHTLTWSRDRGAIREESRIDGIFPLLCTKTGMSSKEVLQVYKYQPRLEKRFCQFKWIHNAAPLLFKKIERVEANMFAFFIALMIQALIEREIRVKMKAEQIPSLTLYPEDREASHPTTSKVMALFDGISTYQVCDETEICEKYKDDLSETQQQILRLMAIPEKKYWDG